MDRDYEVKKTNKIYVSNLNYATTEDDLRKMFEKYGGVRDITLKQKEAITFAFVEFDTIDDAEKAVDEDTFLYLGVMDRNFSAIRSRSILPKEEMTEGEASEIEVEKEVLETTKGMLQLRTRRTYDQGLPRAYLWHYSAKKPREFREGGGGYERKPYGDGERRGGYEDRKGGYENDRRGGYEDRRGGYNKERGGYDRGDRGERGGYDRERGGYDRRGGDRGSGYRGGRDDRKYERKRSSSDGSREKRGGGGRRRSPSSSSRS